MVDIRKIIFIVFGIITFLNFEMSKGLLFNKYNGIVNFIDLIVTQFFDGEFYSVFDNLFRVVVINYIETSFFYVPVWIIVESFYNKVKSGFLFCIGLLLLILVVQAFYGFPFTHLRSLTDLM
jgi:hypothetical protein